MRNQASAWSPNSPEGAVALDGAKCGGGVRMVAIAHAALDEALGQLREELVGDPP